MIIEDFLEAVLPSTGHLCCTTIANGRAAQSFHPTVTSLATAIRAADAQGLETYFGCASYATPGSRKATNALAARALWVDIDVGPGKPYPELADALVALREYVAAVQIGVPLVVGSGGGIHCYWPLDRDVPAVEWQTLAAAFKSSLKLHGLHADPSRTADIASILRPPGTFNRKHTPPVEVVVKRESDTYTVSSIRNALALEVVEITSGDVYSPTDCAENAQLGGAAVEYGPSSAVRIAEACGVIGLMRDTRGQVDQPTWYHSLGVLVHTEEADTVCHEWSSGHKNYRRGETSAKIAQQLQFGPTSCAKLGEHQPEKCAVCPHQGKITSPIILGYERPAAQTVLPAPPGVSLSTALFGPSSASTPAATGPALPYGYRWQDINGSRLIGLYDPSDSASETVWFCRTLFYPVARIAGEDGRFQMEWEVQGRDGVARQFILDNRIIGEGGAALHGLLASYEIVAIPKGKPHMENYIVNFLNHMSSGRATKSYSRFGWSEDKFIVGSTEMAPGVPDMPAVMAGSARHWAKHLEPVGSLDVWKETINTAYNYPGQEVFQYLVLCGFASTLLSFFKSYGGVTVYGWSEGSGHGKTTAMRAALSAWGNWDRMQLADRSTTVNALWGHVSMYGNLPVLFDELTNISQEMASDIVFTTSSGRVKQRSNQDGTLKIGPDAFSTIMLASGNNSLSEKLAGHKSNPAGEVARLFELRVDHMSRLTPNQADVLFPKLLDNYGHAGRVFARFIVDNRDKVEALLFKTRDTFNTNVNITQAERFWSAQHAAVLTALELCNMLDLLHFPRQELYAWVKNRVEDSREMVATSVMPMAERLGELLNYLQPHILTTRGAGNVTRNAPAEIVEPGPRGSLVGRAILPLAADEKPALYIAVSAVRTWCNLNGIAASELQRWGMTEGIIKPRTVSQALGRGTLRYAGGTTATRCWDVDVGRAEQLGLTLGVGANNCDD